MRCFTVTCFWKFEITINTLENVINYKLQVQLQILDEHFSLRALSDVLKKSQMYLNMTAKKELDCCRPFTNLTYAKRKS